MNKELIIKKFNVWLIDDDVNEHYIAQKTYKNCNVTCTSDYDITQVDVRSFDCIVIEQNLTTKQGNEVVKDLRQVQKYKKPIFLVSLASVSDETISELNQLSPSVIFLKKLLKRNYPASAIEETLHAINS